jgi:hypothetical protein
VILSIGWTETKIEGTILVTHPEVGMGLEFSRKTPQQQQHLDTFIQTLVGGSSVPDLFVQPEGLDNGQEPAALDPSQTADPLTTMFRQKSDVPLEEFQREIAKQRGGAEGAHA